MNENIDLTKILKGCPKGTKFYSPLMGEVKFVKIEKESDNKYPIIVCTQDVLDRFATDGHYYAGLNDTEIMLFPSKDQRDWSKFERFWDKPKVERFNPKTLQPFDKVLVKDDIHNWFPAYFTYLEYSLQYPRMMCFDCIARKVIPYNEDTKHLVGTTDDCPEYYKWWEK